MPAGMRISPPLPWSGVVGLGLAASAAALSPAPEPVSTAAEASLPVTAAEPAAREHAIARDDAPPAVKLPALAFALTVGGVTYVRIQDGDAAPHGAPRAVEEGAEVAIVRPRDLPGAQRAWLGRALTIDGTCTAHVVGFAVVARIAGYEQADDVFASGAPVLAARLDGCAGGIARDALRPPAAVPTELDDKELASQARAQVIASQASLETQHAWDDSPGRPRWQDHATITTRVLRHPGTGVTFVLVHAHNEHGCGDPGVNIVATFEVQADRSLRALAIRTSELEHIEAVLDSDGDGRLELVGQDWLGSDTMWQTETGKVLDHIEVPFFGCPC
jgi:hypothetical protein